MPSRGIFKLTTVAAMICLLLTTGCKSSRKVETVASAEMKAADAFFSSVMDKELPCRTLSARTNISIGWTPGKELSSRVDIKFVRDSAFQLSIQPIFGVELFRIEFSVDSVKAVDRMNGRCLLASYADLKQDIDFNFYNLQALFTNRIFEPGRRNVTADRYGRFRLSLRDGASIVQIRDAQRLIYTFTVDGEEKLMATDISAASKYGINWAYSNFRVTDGGRAFPMQMDVKASAEKKVVATASITFARIQPDAVFVMDFPSVDKYRRVSFNDLIKGLRFQ
jgi:hypothetical protein